MAQVHDSPPTRVVELAVNLDDVTGEQVGDAIDRLMALGACDAWAVPITMKKGRPAVMLCALVDEASHQAMARQMLTLTGSFGVRYRPWDRLVLERQWHSGATRLGEVQLKVGSLDGRTVTVKPECDDVARLAESAGVSFAQAQRAAQAAADTLLAERCEAEGGRG